MSHGMGGSIRDNGPMNTPEGTARVRRADAHDNDAAIIAAARRLMADGRRLPSMRAVAREAGVAAATVYRRFPSRESLESRVNALVLCDELAPSFVAARRTASPLGGLREITSDLVRLSQSQRAGEGAGPATLADLVDAFLERYTSELAALMHEAQAAGELRADTNEADIPRIATLMLAGLALPDRLSDSPERYIAVIFDGLSRTDAPPLPPVARRRPPGDTA